MMNTFEKVQEILKEVKPTKNLDGITDIVEGGYIDSFELMYLISMLNERFNIEISVDDMTVENFNSVETIGNMVERLMNCANAGGSN